jgi:hypothetical protein
MKLKDYLDGLLLLVKENPEYQDFEVVYSVDDEGNRFSPICYDPTVGFYEDGEFYCPHEFKDFDLTEEKPNSICIN